MATLPTFKDMSVNTYAVLACIIENLNTSKLFSDLSLLAKKKLVQDCQINITTISQIL